MIEYQCADLEAFYFTEPLQSNDAYCTVTSDPTDPEGCEYRINCICATAQAYGLLYNNGKNVFEDTWWFSTISILSILGFLGLGLAIKFNPSLQVHPMKLVMWISFADSALCNIVLMSYNVCSDHLYEFFASTVMFSSDIEDQYRALWILQASKNIIAVFLTLLIFLMNMCLAIDLIWMIRYPFASKSKNIPLFLLFSFSVALVLTVLWYNTIQYQKVGKRDVLEPVPDNYIIVATTSVIVSYFTASVVSVLYALKHLCTGGISRKSSQTVIIRHILSIVGFSIGQIYCLLCFSALLDSLLTMKRLAATTKSSSR